MWMFITYNVTNCEMCSLRETQVLLERGERREAMDLRWEHNLLLLCHPHLENMLFHYRSDGFVDKFNRLVVNGKIRNFLKINFHYILAYQAILYWYDDLKSHRFVPFYANLANLSPILTSLFLSIENWTMTL